MAEPGQPGSSAAGDPAADVLAAPYSPHAIHLLRTVQLNSLRLSQMADQKASILLGATLLVFSISLGRGLDGALPWSLLVLASFAFGSSLCAVRTVMPSLSRSLPPGVERNPLFFGHFHDQAEDDWAGALLARLHADEPVFRLMLHDIYQNGQVLQRRKYRYLTYAYRLLVVGLLASLVTFALELTGRL